VSVSSLRVATTGILVRLPERVLASLFLLVGASLVYLVLFDQGAAAAVILGAAAGRENLLHELFHDGRHLWNAPCH
jgi:hypothetical protein